jgi:hypothetical protein
MHAAASLMFLSLRNAFSAIALIFTPLSAYNISSFIVSFPCILFIFLPNTDRKEDAIFLDA